MTKNIMVLNGPNLNLLGTRQPTIYGSETLTDIEAACLKLGKKLDLRIEFRQSNSEGCLVDWIQESTKNFNGLVLNPGAYSHTSIAMMDALLNCNIPIIEVHLSNIHSREEFRHNSYTARIANGVICGFGALGYELALESLY